MREIGAKFAARARQLGLTDAEVARRLGLSQSRYSAYVNGSREPDFATFGRICRELGLTPDAVLGFDAAPEIRDPDRATIAALLDRMGPEDLDLAIGVLRLIVARQAPRAEARSRPSARRRSAEN